MYCAVSDPLYTMLYVATSGVWYTSGANGKGLSFLSKLKMYYNTNKLLSHCKQTTENGQSQVFKEPTDESSNQTATTSKQLFHHEVGSCALGNSFIQWRRLFLSLEWQTWLFFCTAVCVEGWRWAANACAFLPYTWAYCGKLVCMCMVNFLWIDLLLSQWTRRMKSRDTHITYLSRMVVRSVHILMLCRHCCYCLPFLILLLGWEQGPWKSSSLRVWDLCSWYSELTLCKAWFHACSYKQ